MARFKKGDPSPNPNGRPPGAKSATNLLRSEMVTDADLQTIVTKVVAMAKAGDLAAAALVLNRTIPVLKPRIADPDEEVGMAEALQAARLRAMASTPFRINVLEALVTQSMDVTTGVIGGLVGGDQLPDMPAPARAAVTAHAAPAPLEPAPAPQQPATPPPRLTAITDAPAWCPGMPSDVHLQSPQPPESYDPYE